MVVKIFGERNTASNYLELLINENIPCQIIKSNLPNLAKVGIRSIRAIDRRLGNWRLDEHIRDICYLNLLPNRLGWKHRLLPSSENECVLPKDIYYLLTVRNPFAWLSSMYKRPHNLSINTEEITFSEFLRNPCKTVRREMVSFKEYEDPIEIWNVKTSALLSFSKIRESLIFRHEDLVLQPDRELERLSNELKVRFKQDNVIIPGESTKKDGRTKSDLESYIHKKKWMDIYSEEDLNYVESRLDKELLSHFDYLIDRGI